MPKPTWPWQVLHIPAAELATWLAIPSTVHIWGGLATGAIESALLDRGVSQLEVRTSPSSMRQKQVPNLFGNLV
jgi:hypothetical protein